MRSHWHQLCPSVKKILDYKWVKFLELNTPSYRVFYGLFEKSYSSYSHFKRWTSDEALTAQGHIALSPVTIRLLMPLESLPVHALWWHNNYKHNLTYVPESTQLVRGSSVVGGKVENLARSNNQTQLLWELYGPWDAASLSDLPWRLH